MLQVGTHRFSDNYDWFLEYRSVLPITCGYAAIAQKILFTLLISMFTYLVRCLRDLIQPVLATCVIEQRSIMYRNDYTSLAAMMESGRATKFVLRRWSISVTMKKVNIIIYFLLLLNSLGPIADISAIISTICFRRHNLCKKCQNLTNLAILKNIKKTIKKPVTFRRALLLNVQCGISVTSMCIFIIFIFMKTKWLPYIF